MKNQKGFVWLPVLLGILALEIVFGGGYFFIHKHSNTQAQTPNTIATSTQTSSAHQIIQKPPTPHLCDQIPDGADPTTYQDKSVDQDDFTQCIGIDAKHIFVDNKLVPNSNASQFVLLPPNGTKTCQYFFRIQGAGVYSGVRLIPGADPENFVDLTIGTRTCYGKDLLRVYIDTGEPAVISGADPHTFVVLNSNYSKDATHVWYVGGEYDKGESIPGSDPDTFVVLSDGYAKDAAHVYSDNNIIVGADPRTFVLLNSSFAKDAAHVYYGTTPLTGVDPASVTILNSDYLKDKNQVYTTPFLAGFQSGSLVVQYQANSIPQADPTTFIALSLGYGKDSRNVFWSDYNHKASIVQGADQKTFTVADTYAKDFAHIYDMGTVLKDADVTTFKILPGGDYATFYVDKSHAWVRGGIGKGGIGEIPGADPNTLVVTGPEEAKDANHTYSFSAKGYFLIDGAGGPNF